MTTKESAYHLYRQGIVSIPIDNSDTKKPAPDPKNPKYRLKWGELTTDNYNEGRIEQLFAVPHQSLAVLGGFISTGLEVLDVDLKHARDPEQLWTDLRTNIEEALPDFAAGCTIAKTPSGGYHIYYSCWEIEGNKKLAYEDHDGKRVCVIETRGDGGYALTWPSPGYEIIQGGIDRFAYALNTDERDTLHEICRIFNEEVEDVAYQETKRFVPKGRNFISNPFDDYRDRVPFHEVEALIKEAGFEKPKQKGPRVFFHRIGSDNEQGANYHLEKKCLYVWTSNSRLSPDRGYNPTSLLCLLRHGGDWKETYKWLVKNGYGERIQADDEPYIDQAHKRLEGGEKREEIAKDLPQDRADKYIDIAQNRLVRMETFWEEDDKGKVSIDIVRLKQFLENRGFRKYKFPYNDQESVLVHICSEKHRIKEVDIEFVKKFLEHYLYDEQLALPVRLQHDVLRALMKMTSQFFKEQMFEWLDAVKEGKDVKIITDTSTASYFFFDDQYIRITSKKPEIYAYGHLDDDQVIWDKDVIKKKVSLINIKDKINDSDYFRFLKRLVMLGPDTDEMELKDLEEKRPEEYDKLRAFITTIGYLCHRYNDRKRPWAVIIAEDILNSSEGGGTGKGIFMNSLSKVRKAVYEAGKSFDPTSQFAFQKWEPGTNLYLIDDVSRKFDFESMYNFISDGGSVERKYHRAFQLPFDQLPKFIFSTNYGDMADGNTHGERRRKLLLVGKYYGEHLTPYQEFGRNLFNEWDAEQWNLFYNFIFYCIQQYLEHGVRDFPASENVKIKTFLSDYGSEIFEFFELIKGRDWAVPVLLSDLRDEFHNTYDRKNFSAQLFKIALDKYCRMFEIEKEESLGTSRANRSQKLIRFIGSVTSKDGLLNIGPKKESEVRKTDDLPF